MISVRAAIASDLPHMLEIYNEIIINTTAVYHYEPHTLDMRTDWFETRKREGFPIFVAAESNDILGFSSYGPFRPWPGYKYTVENSVYVAASQRGRGISKLLMPPIIDAAKEQNLHAMIAVIDASNDVSINLHKQFGFEEVAHLKQVGFKFNRWLDLKFMELILG